MSFWNRAVCKVQSAILVALAIVSTVGATIGLTIGTTRTIDYFRGAESGTTFNDLRSILSHPGFSRFLATALAAFATNRVEEEVR